MSEALFLTVAEAAEMAAVDERTMRRAIGDGQVPAVRFGRVTRIPRAAFLALAGVESTPDNDRPDARPAPGLAVVRPHDERTT